MRRAGGLEKNYDRTGSYAASNGNSLPKFWGKTIGSSFKSQEFWILNFLDS